MNINGFLTFSTILLILVYLLVYQFDPDYEENMAKFVPDNALIYLEQRDGRKALETFRGSKLSENFDKINFWAVGREIGLPHKITEVLESFQGSYHRLFENRLVDILIGKRVGFALFQSDTDLEDFSLQTYVRHHSVIVTEPRYNADILLILAREYTNEKISFQTLQYGNHQITRVSQNKDKIALAVIEGMIVASFSEKLLKKAIDAFDGETGSMYNRDDFSKAQDLFEKPDRFIYLPIETVHLFADTLYEYVPNNHIALVEKQLDLFQGFSGAMYGAWSRGSVVEDKIVLTYKKGLTSDAAEKFLDTPPSHNNMLELTTSDPLAYYWSNTMDLNYFLKYLPAHSDEDNHVSRYIQRLENLSEKKIEELLLDLGSEISLVVEKNKEDEFIPVPRAAAFFRVNPDLDLSSLVNYIVHAFDVPVIEQLYNSVTYLYWVASPQDGLQPLCGYWSNYFFIGNSGILVERVIDGYNEEGSLLSNPELKKIEPGVTEVNNSVTYLNNSEILALLERLLSALATIATIEDRQKAEKARIVIDKIISPLFSGLKEYKRSFTRSYFTPGMVIIDSRTSVSREINP